MAKTRRKKKTAKRRRWKKFTPREAVILAAAAVLMIACVMLILYIPKFARSGDRQMPNWEPESSEEVLVVTCGEEQLPYLENDDGLYVDFESLNAACLQGMLFIDMHSEQVFHTTPEAGKQVTSFAEIPLEAAADRLFVQLDWATEQYHFTNTQQDAYHIELEPLPEEPAPAYPEEPIVMGWLQDYSGEYTEEKAAEIGGDVINVLSPTWFSLNEEGTFTTYANAEWVTFAHEQDMQIWAHVDNGMEDARTLEALRDEEHREVLIKYLVQQCRQLQLDGINLDFEMLSAETAEYFVEFTRELGAVLRPEGFVLSVDVMVPQAWSAYYHRDRLGRACDYVIVMAYDEHYEGSEAGSVASMPFTRAAVQDMLELVPAQKLLLGIPFYSRIWYSGSKTETTAWGMRKMAEYLEKHDLKPTYDEESGQDLVTRKDGTVTETLWLENAASVQKRLDLADKYELAGVAAWKLGLETEDVRPLLREYRLGDEE